MLGDMGYADKLQKLCALRGMDQSTLADKVSLSKSSMSRILSGIQEPKLRLAYDLAKALGVSLDYLVDDSITVENPGQFVYLSDDELTILKLVRRLGTDVSMNRLLAVTTTQSSSSPQSSTLAHSANESRSPVTMTSNSTE